MLYPNYEHTPLSVLPEEATEPPLTEYQRRYIERRSRLWPRIGNYGLIAVAATTPYWIDVGINTINEREATPSISVVAEPLDEANDHKATILFNGFNTINANGLVKSLGESIQQYADGELWSVHYDNALLNDDKIYDAILDLAEQRGITSISIGSYSMGAVSSSEVVKDLIVDSPLAVEHVSFYSSPSGYDGLQPERQAELDFAHNVAALVPGSSHSTFWRYIVELFFYKDIYIKDDGFRIDKFFKVGGDIIERFQNGEYTTNAFLLSQIDALSGADIARDIKKIGENPQNKPLPTFMYFGIGEDGRDDMVDNEYSSQVICDAARKAGMACLTYTVSGAVHSEYYRSIDAYMVAAQTAAEDAAQIAQEDENPEGEMINASESLEKSQ